MFKILRQQNRGIGFAMPDCVLQVHSHTAFNATDTWVCSAAIIRYVASIEWNTFNFIALMNSISTRMLLWSWYFELTLTLWLWCVHMPTKLVEHDIHPSTCSNGLVFDAVDIVCFLFLAILRHDCSIVNTCSSFLTYCFTWICSWHDCWRNSGIW